MHAARNGVANEFSVVPGRHMRQCSVEFGLRQMRRRDKISVAVFVFDKSERGTELLPRVEPLSPSRGEERLPLGVVDHARKNVEPHVAQDPETYNHLEPLKLFALLSGKQLRQSLPLPKLGTVLEVVDQQIRVPCNLQWPSTVPPRKQLWPIVVAEMRSFGRLNVLRKAEAARSYATDRVVHEVDASLFISRCMSQIRRACHEPIVALGSDTLEDRPHSGDVNLHRRTGDALGVRNALFISQHNFSIGRLKSVRIGA